MDVLQQIDDRRMPWVAYAGSRVALIAATLPGAHDERHRLSKSLLQRFKEQVLAVANGAIAFSMPLLLGAVRNAFTSLSNTEGWGLHFGVVVVAETSWRVWTAGLVYCARWSPGEWRAITEPQSVARHLREHGAREISAFGEDVAVKVAGPSTNAGDIEYAEVARGPVTGVVLLGSAEAGRRLEAAAGDPTWRLISAPKVLDPAAPLTPGCPEGTLVVLVD